MKILEYDQVDPMKVMYLNELALDFPLTPEMAACIRRNDPRAFPCLAIYALEEEAVVGQAGIFRLPMISTEGREDVGGIWAPATHPEYIGRGITSLLIQEAHTRMRDAGLRFSTLVTNRYRSEYNLYCQHGYEEADVWAAGMARWETTNLPTRLCAERTSSGGYEAVEHIYQEVARDCLGFAWRDTPFYPLGRVNLSDIWILKENNHALGYTFSRLEGSTLTISELALPWEINLQEAIAAIAARMKATYIQIKVSRPVEINYLRQAGYFVSQRIQNSFMIKPLIPSVSINFARQLFGISTNKFLISSLDVA